MRTDISPVVTPTTKVISIPVGRPIYLYIDQDKVGQVKCTKAGLYTMDLQYHHLDIDEMAYAKNYSTLQKHWDEGEREEIEYNRWMVWDTSRWDKLDMLVIP